MPRAKQKAVGTSRRRKADPAAKADNATVGAEAAIVTMDAIAADSLDPGNVAVEEPSSIADLSSIPQDQAAPALMLPDCLDSAAAITIKEMLLSQRGNALAVDASQVRRVGVQSLQVLVAAARAWQHDGLSYRLENPSPEFLETIALVGLPTQDLLLEGHQ